MTDTKKLPTPRLQLRWAPSLEKAEYDWECHYELVLPLGKHDIRGEREGPRGGKLPNLTELVVPIKGPSLRRSSATPCTPQNGGGYYDPPYRDGAHASWDADALGGLPIYVIAPDGKAFSKAEEDERRAAKAGSPS